MEDNRLEKTVYTDGSMSLGVTTGDLSLMPQRVGVEVASQETFIALNPEELVKMHDNIVKDARIDLEKQKQEGSEE